jgi:hypothetical protein
MLDWQRKRRRSTATNGTIRFVPWQPDRLANTDLAGAHATSNRACNWDLVVWSSASDTACALDTDIRIVANCL